MTEHTIDSQACYLIEKITHSPQESPVRKVKIVDGEVVVHFETRGSLDLWTSIHGGYFTTFPISFEQWERKEKNRFLPFQKARRIEFFAVVSSQYIRIYPTREYS